MNAYMKGLPHGGALPPPPSHMRGQCHSGWKAFILIVLFCQIASGTLNFSQCSVDMISCATNDQNCPKGLSNTTALPYLFTSNGFASVADLNSSDTIYMKISAKDCTSYCGTGDEAFSWSIFSQEFAAWLLPYLALVSQLPFGSERRTDDLMSVILTLGSPTLAGYSLYVTILNARWLNDDLFAGIDYPSALGRQAVVQVLNCLQYVPLRIHSGIDGRFESLVVHPDNVQWWSTLAQRLNYSHTWSIASATSITWVVIAYLLTVADSLSNVANNINSNGQGTGSVWLWLLPIVIGWSVLSPKCDYYRVQDAYNRANEEVYELDSHDSSVTPTPTRRVTSNFGLTIGPRPPCKFCDRDITSADECSIPPVFNYARVLPWSRTVYRTALFYHAAWRSCNGGIGVDEQSISTGNDTPRECRLETRDQIANYCLPNGVEKERANDFWPRGVLFNMVVASLMSLQLQWATTGAAFLVFWFTPTAGLGCRSLAFLLYGSLSTIIWVLMVLSSILDNYADHPKPNDLPLARDMESCVPRVPFPTAIPSSDSGVDTSESGSLLENQDHDDPSAETARPKSTGNDSYHARRKYIRSIADLLRWTGKLLAVINAIGVIVISIFQYANVFDSCYCNSSTIGWGSSANVIFQPMQSEIDQAKRAWLGGVALALISCLFFVGSIYFIRDSLPL